MPDVNVTIIIPAKNEAKNLPSVLDALKNSIETFGRNVEIILVDNGSADLTVKIAHEYGCLILEDCTATISRLRNIGAKKARGDIIAFLDADCLVDRNWLKLCVEDFNDARIGIVGTRAIPDLRNPTWVEEGWFGLVSGADRPDYPGWIGTSNLLIRKNIFNDIQGFDEELETAEDVDLCRRVSNSCLIYLEKRICTIHLRESKNIFELYKRERWRGKSSLLQLIKFKNVKKELPSVIVPGMLLVNSVIVIVCFFCNVLISVTFMIILALMPIAMIIKKKSNIGSMRQFIIIYLVALVYLIARCISLAQEIFNMSIIKMRNTITKVR